MMMTNEQIEDLQWMIDEHKVLTKLQQNMERGSEAFGNATREQLNITFSLAAAVPELLAYIEELKTSLKQSCNSQIAQGED